MTAQGWLDCISPWPMLSVLKDWPSDRKLRLFAIACCRQIKHLISDERSQSALEVCEQFVEGFGSLDVLQRAFQAAINVYDENQDDSIGVESAALAIASVCWTTLEDRDRSLGNVVDNVIGVARHCFPWKNAKQIQSRRLCRFLRDIFGNPFQPVAMEAQLLAWNDGTIPAIARRIYDEQAFQNLPILGDALEEAGCTDEVILSHCRTPCDHVRGCWLIDAILQNE